jgi:hypothetical protein
MPHGMGMFKRIKGEEMRDETKLEAGMKREGNSRLGLVSGTFKDESGNG